MVCTVTDESFDWFAACWRDNRHGLRWDTLFVLPPWLQVWRQVFAPESTVRFSVVRQDGQVIGIAPLLPRDGMAMIVGSPDVCDYADLIVAPGREPEFCDALLGDLKQKGVGLLDLGSLRPESTAKSWLVELARDRGYAVSCREEALSLERDLPATWEEYLQLLSAKQRHEIRRKLRRLEEAGNINYRFVEDTAAVPDFLDIFLRLFIEGQKDKATFMTGEMEAFFRSMAMVTAEAGLLRSGILELDNIPVAVTLAFDFNDVIYLYNSAYDPRYRSLSVGVLSKALYIKDSIERGKRRFDFMKGEERYKYHLGGQEIPLYRCQITI